MRKLDTAVFAAIFLCLTALGSAAQPLPAVDKRSSLESHEAPAAIPVSVASWTQLAELAASQSQQSSQFGVSVAVSGTVGVVGSDADPNGSGYGAAYVFAKSSGTPPTKQPIARLTASDGQANDLFGYSVSISGDTVVACAPAANGRMGKAYIFVKPPSGWTDMTETAQLTASDGQAGSGVCSSVSISGTTVVVGASTSAGAGAYVFVQPPSGWTNMTQTAELTASNGILYPVAISGNTIAVGGHDTEHSHGAVYVFVRGPSGWADMTESAELTNSLDPLIGVSVAISDRIIAAGSSANAGAAYVYVEPNGGWEGTSQPNAKLTASQGRHTDQMGASVATNGNSVVVGAPHACGGDNCQRGAGPGVVYAFAEPASGWTDMTEGQKLIPSDGMPRGSFGQSVAASGAGVLVGAPGMNTAYAYQYDSNSGFTGFSAPGSTSTRALGVNNLGQIVGVFTSPSCSVCGFLVTNRVFTKVAYPGGNATNPTSINDLGEIVGYYSDIQGATHGFTELNSIYTTLDYPSGGVTSLTGVDNAGDVVGDYYDGDNVSHGFLYSAGVFTPIAFPGAQSSFVQNISLISGAIVGNYCLAPCSTLNGFIENNGVFATVDYPGEPYTSLFGINDNGDLSGAWSSSKHVSAFVFLDENQKFVNFGIGGIPANTAPSGINDSDAIAGWFCPGTSCYGFYGHLPGH